jgi:hypothetical protein
MLPGDPTSGRIEAWVLGALVASEHQQEKNCSMTKGPQSGHRHDGFAKKAGQKAMMKQNKNTTGTDA